MTKFGVIGRGVMFAIVGIVTVIVGSFLLRGNMHMWDKSKSKKQKKMVTETAPRGFNPRT